MPSPTPASIRPLPGHGRSLPASPRVQRVSDARTFQRRRAAERLARVIVEVGSSRAAVARHLALHSSVLDEWCNPFGSARPAAGDIDAMPRAVAAAYHRDAEHEIDPAPRANLAPERHALCVEREWGDVCRELEAALADGRIDAAERARVARELRQVRERVDAMLADLEAAS